MNIEDYISKTSFFKQYHSVSPKLYGQFCAKFNELIESKLDKGISVESIGFRSQWKDEGRNIHCTLKGKVCRSDEIGEVRGEIVLLKNSMSFRGWANHSLKKIEDWEYIHNAREVFKLGDYMQCLALLSLVSDRSNLSPANLRMKTLAEDKKSNQRTHSIAGSAVSE